MKRSFFLAFGLAFLIVFAIAPPASAQAENPFYVGIFGGYVIPDDLKVENGGRVDLELDNSWAAGAKLGYIFPMKWLAAELEYTHLGDQDFDKFSGDYSANNAMLNLILRYPEGRFHPYIGAGAGWSWGSIDASHPVLGSIDESDNAFGWQLLAGINMQITENFSADLAYKYFQSKYEIEDVDATARDHIVMFGLNYHFGGAAPAPAAKAVQEERRAEPAAAAVAEPPVVAAPAVKDVDSDGDGVVDRLDKCPDTPKGCTVDKDGCPMDSDKDGVCDGLDKCPDTPAGCAVDKNGCPLDSDKDGVIDCRDKCPNTPEGAKVDENGCPVYAVIRLNVEFDTNKAVVKPKYMGDIKRVADFMKAHPNLNATIEGHTDSVGSAKSNLALSQKRADAVRNVLVKKEKIAPERLKAVGYGESKPIASNDTKEGKQKNRRVEAVLKAQEFKK